VLSEDPKPLSQTAPHLGNWSPFFQRALDKDPAQRFQSADEMAQAVLAAARGGASLRPPPPTLQAGAQPGDYRASSAGMPYAAMLAQTAPRSVPMPVPATYQSAAAQQQSGLMPSPAYSTPYPPGVEPSGIMAAPMSAIAALSAPGSRPNATLASTPPPSMPAPVPAGAGVGPTHVSQQRPPGSPLVQDHTPSIQVIEAPKPPGVAVWVVAVTGFVCFGLGLALGLMLR
jgi:serine/threonine-protein kinase